MRIINNHAFVTIEGIIYEINKKYGIHTTFKVVHVPNHFMEISEKISPMYMFDGTCPTEKVSLDITDKNNIKVTIFNTINTPFHKTIASVMKYLAETVLISKMDKSKLLPYIINKDNTKMLSYTTFVSDFPYEIDDIIDELYGKSGSFDDDVIIEDPSTNLSELVMFIMDPLIQFVPNVNINIDQIFDGLKDVNEDMAVKIKDGKISVYFVFSAVTSIVDLSGLIIHSTPSIKALTELSIDELIAVSEYSETEDCYWLTEKFFKEYEDAIHIASESFHEYMTEKSPFDDFKDTENIFNEKSTPNYLS